jgi:hypothetical protein
MNEHVIIIGMALLVYFLAFGGRAGVVAAGLSIIMIVGAIRHPEIAPSGQQLEGTPEEQLQIIMLMVALILFPPLVWFWLKELFRRGGR